MKPILLVDDEVDLVTVLHDALEIYGFKVATAYNGQEALEYLLSNEPQPAVIFLDLTMPIMNGLKFLEHLHSGGYPTLSQIPIVIISAVGEFIHLARFNCAAILRKPTSLEKIVEMADRYAEKQQR